jgi:hypothetical protein
MTLNAPRTAVLVWLDLAIPGISHRYIYQIVSAMSSARSNPAKLLV